jgi:small subunit ribosomal protein S9
MSEDVVTGSTEVLEPVADLEPLTETLGSAVEAPAPTPGPAAAPAPTVAPVRRRREGPPQTVGRRKESVVRVRLLPGAGKFTLNGRTLESYFPNKVHQQMIREPLVTLEKADSFDVVATLRGGGVTGQAGALRLALARALIEDDPETRPTLKHAGFLTRDPRIKERKKYGLKKARKAPQYSKR